MERLHEGSISPSDRLPSKFLVRGERRVPGVVQLPRYLRDNKVCSPSGDGCSKLLPTCPPRPSAGYPSIRPPIHPSTSSHSNPTVWTSSRRPGQLPRRLPVHPTSLPTLHIQPTQELRCLPYLISQRQTVLLYSFYLSRRMSTLAYTLVQQSFNLPESLTLDPTSGCKLAAFLVSTHPPTYPRRHSASITSWNTPCSFVFLNN
ncbi:hypothetical protein B0T17DRAFT_21237 [Bombardia bombarda]|uniref:Uncharacterized protein n=1 Tax=Bombardia bombarda TaxID=252184 RepID=A0AA40CDK5_9PEZI|nr:hypothetical protein B0T17DRAFT_21237 [Bombardia bombarda]